MAEGYTILADGGGTVGSRIARAARSMGHNVIVTKYSAGNQDIKMDEIQELLRDFPDVRLYVIDGPDVEKRMREFRRRGVEVAGTVDDIPYAELTHVVNAAKEGKEREDDARYGRHGLRAPVLWQAKTPHELASGEQGAGVFISVPRSDAARNSMRYEGRSALNCSCNDHFMQTATGIVLGAIRPGQIRRVSASLFRRYGDRLIDRNKQPRHGPVIERSVDTESDYITHFNRMFPELEGRLVVHRFLGQHEHFHAGVLEFEVDGGISDETFDAVKQGFSEYPRCVFLGEPGKDIGKRYSADDIVKACNVHKIPHEGDVMLLTYTAERPASDILAIKGLNPQRSVVVPSAMDWLEIADGADWRTAFADTNQTLRWHGHAILELKERMETYLRRELGK